MEPMRSGGRLGRSVVTLLAVSLFVFAVFELRPAAHVTRVLGPGATAIDAERFEERMGLQRPAPVRYSAWLGSMLKGDFGTSFSGGLAREQTVAAVIGPRFSNTVLLAAFSLALTLPLALALGLLLVVYRGGHVDATAGAAVRVAAAAPLFVVALLTIGWGPLASEGTLRFTWPWSLVFAGAILSITLLGPAVQAVRGIFRQIAAEPHVEMAHLRGMPPWMIAFRHVLPPARAPLATAISRGSALFVTALIVVETACRYPGIGALMVDAALAADVPVVQLCALLLALGVIAAATASASLATAADLRTGRAR